MTVSNCTENDFVAFPWRPISEIKQFGKALNEKVVLGARNDKVRFGDIRSIILMSQRLEAWISSSFSTESPPEVPFIAGIYEWAAPL